MTSSSFAGGRWPTKEAAVLDIQKMLGIDRISAIYTASVLDQKFGNKYSGKFLNAKTIRQIMNSSIRQGTANIKEADFSLRSFNSTATTSMSGAGKVAVTTKNESNNNKIIQRRNDLRSAIQKQAVLIKNASVQDKMLSTIGIDRSQYRAATLSQKESRLKNSSYTDPVVSAKAFHTIHNYQNYKPLPEENPRKSDAWLTIQKAHHYGWDGGGDSNHQEAVKRQPIKSAASNNTNEPPAWLQARDFTLNKSQYLAEQAANNNNQIPSNIKTASKQQQQTKPAWLMTRDFILSGATE